MNSTARALLIWSVGIIASVGLLIGLAKLGASSGTPKNVNIVLDTTDHVNGPTSAKAQLVVYGDFECPACGAYEPMINAVKNSFGDKVALVFRHYPLPQHKFAQITSQAAEAAALQGKFWEMHDLLYAKQSTWSTANNIKETLTGYASELKLDTTKFNADLETSTIKDRIQRDITSGNSYNIPGTPTFFLNGQEVQLPVTQQSLTDKINVILNS
jgi:protein-disulfide isomerase